MTEAARLDGEAKKSFLGEAVDADGFLVSGPAKALGRSLRAEYTAAVPFPHIVLGDFFDEGLLDDCLDAFPDQGARKSAQHRRQQENLKASYNPDELKSSARLLFYIFNSAPFLQFLEELTGIKGLIADPYFVGGGFHATANGGHLDIHADFNLHPRLRLERRLNVLIYLNRDWTEDYGGCLELWDSSMKECLVKVVPRFNRCVIFNTTSASWHGHPEPVKHPDDIPRRSLALYYYTATWDDTRRSRSTKFQIRPDSRDTFDWQLRGREAVQEILPPLLYRTALKLARKLFR